MSQPTRRRSLIGLALAVTLAAAGCGVSGSTDTVHTAAPVVHSGTAGAQFIRDGAARTSQVSSMKFTTTVTVDGLPIASGMTVSSHGEFDRATGRAHLVTDLGGLASIIGSHPRTTAGSGDLSKALGSMEMISDGTTVYAKGGAFSMLGATDAKPWLKIDAAHALEGRSLTAGQLGGNPTSILEVLKGAGANLTTIGNETVRGTATKHVRAVIDITALLDRAPAAERAKLDAVLTQLGARGKALRSQTVDVWVDGQGMVRRIRLTTDLSVLGGSGASSTMTAEFYDFGVPNTITVPPASQVQPFDLGKLGQLGQHGGH